MTGGLFTRFPSLSSILHILSLPPPLPAVVGLAAAQMHTAALAVALQGRGRGQLPQRPSHHVLKRPSSRLPPPPPVNFVSCL